MYSRPATPIGSPEGVNSIKAAHDRRAALRATQNATGSHKTGLHINTLAINENGTHALVGGKEIFRTIKVEDGVCVEDLDLRGAIRKKPTTASGIIRQNYSIDIADVAWAKAYFGNFVAAATSSGKIVVYDLGHAELQSAQLHEHFRQVHRVTFNPHQGSLLLSGSQDGTVRLWDVRDMREANTVQSKRKYSGQSDGVRDVKWSPTEEVNFACGTDSGWVQCWDMRNLKGPKVRIPAHIQTCNTIDWHPDGVHIASTSSDKTVRVWDSLSDGKQQEIVEITTPYPVLNARWRPSCESPNDSESNARQCTQIVTAYDNDHSVLHVWDVRRPALPFREVSPYASAPTDLLWHSQDLLWTVGREGTFLQTDIQHAPKVMDQRNLSCFAVSSRNELWFITQRRGRPRKQQQEVSKEESSASSSKARTSSQTDESTTVSRSWTDDTLDHSFLQSLPTRPRARSVDDGKTGSKNQGSVKEQHQGSTRKLDEVLTDRKSFKPKQVAIRGHLPTTQEPWAVRHLAEYYKSAAAVDISDDGFLDSFEKTIDHNARVADEVGLYRIGQTWRILGFSASWHLKERAAARREQRLGKKPLEDARTIPFVLSEVMASLMLEDPSSAAPMSIERQKPVSLITEQLAQLSAGNVVDKEDMIRQWSSQPVFDPTKQSDAATASPRSTYKDATVGSFSSFSHNSDNDSDSDNDKPIPLYLPLDNDPDLEADKPFTLLSMLREVITHYAATEHISTAASLILLFSPLLPRTHPLPASETTATVLAYLSSYESTDFSPEEISSILDTHLCPLVNAGLQPLWLESIMSTYHHQLTCYEQFAEAAALRRWCYPAFPAVYEGFLRNNFVGLACGGCRKAISVPCEWGGKCGSCGVELVECAVCWQGRSPFAHGKGRETLMTACLRCGHGCHDACRQACEEDGVSGCVVQGCLCESC